ncbi:UNVERIFIED_CONTAM: hypothetical protein FKN15_075113 [Acipenser sinensis]
MNAELQGFIESSFCTRKWDAELVPAKAGTKRGPMTHPLNLHVFTRASTCWRLMEFWKTYYTVSTNLDPQTERSDAMYMVVPLLGVALLIIIALFIIWRCQLQKATRRRPAYSQNRYLTNRTSRSLPRILVHREPSHTTTELPHHEPSARAGAASSGHANRTLYVQDTSVSVASRLSSARTLYVQSTSVSVASRLSSATPPPSYEEVTGHVESSSDENSAPYSDPPPKYEEIVRQK